MSPMQEAYCLLQYQPEHHIRIIVDLLRTMNRKEEDSVTSQTFKRTGVAKGKIHLPPDFDEHFDDLNQEIAELFYGGIP